MNLDGGSLSLPKKNSSPETMSRTGEILAEKSKNTFFERVKNRQESTKKERQIFKSPNLRKNRNSTVCENSNSNGFGPNRADTTHQVSPNLNSMDTEKPSPSSSLYVDLTRGNHPKASRSYIKNSIPNINDSATKTSERPKTNIWWKSG